MSLKDKILFGFIEEDKLIKKLMFNPYYQKINSGAELYAKINGEKFLNLASNNYLALATDSRIINRMKNALDKYGASMCGTPIACGNADIYQQATEYVSKFLGLEDAILFPSCYQANMAIIGSLVKSNDVVFVDRFAHSSLIEGIKSTGCKIKPFKHNSVEYLQKLIKRSENFNNRFVVTESVFSTEGSIAPFDEIYDLAQTNEVISIIDDSHGIGVIGETGKGILEEKKIENFDGIYTASTGKALGVSGGIVSSSYKVIEFFKYYSSSLIYSTALAPALIAGTLQSLQIINIEGKKMVQTLSQNKRYLSEKLQKSGFNLMNSEAFICSILTGSNENTFRVCKSLFEKNILTTPFIYPSVSKNKGIIRMIPRIDLSQNQMDYVIRSFEEIREKNSELFEKC